jgi:predicted NACHT family NTPase
MQANTKDFRHHINPREDRELINYQQVVRENHWFIRLLDTGMDRRERTISLPESNRLFVMPYFTLQNIDAQYAEEIELEALTDFDTLLSKHKKLFIKGDPGTGKTTLINRISYMLCQPLDKQFTKQHGHLIPFPIILRDVNLTEVSSLEDLIQAFFNLHWIKDHRLSLETCFTLLKNGQAFILLDGLDEIVHPETRQRIAHIIFEGQKQYPDSYWWLSTRIVGFDQYTFFNFVYSRKIASKRSEREGLDEALEIESEATNATEEAFAPHHEQYTKNVNKDEWQEYFLAPFNNEQVKTFMKGWYDLYEPNDTLRAEALGDFVRGLESHPRIMHLARVPLLLTMMALFHHTNQDFPDGRVELYQSITEAYLDKIMRRRKIAAMHDLSVAEQKACMKAIAYEMQCVRSGRDNPQNLVISETTCERICTKVLQKLNTARPDGQVERANTWLRALHIRSELLIPKGRDKTGEEVYGFLHLSYQEFFAAEELKSYFQKYTSRRVSPEEAHTWWENTRSLAMQTHWHETFLLFFESFLASFNPDEERFLDAFEGLFEWKVAEPATAIHDDLAPLAAKILCDEFVARVFPARDEMMDHLYISYDDSWEVLNPWGAKRGVYLQLTAAPPPRSITLLRAGWMALSQIALRMNN